jgi:hypothetical protein
LPRRARRPDRSPLHGSQPRGGRRSTVDDQLRSCCRLTTRERWRHVHDLLDHGIGLGECARRLNLSLNTVKRYARIAQPERLVRAPAYRPTLVDPYRDHLRQRRNADPAVAVTTLLA